MAGPQTTQLTKNGSFAIKKSTPNQTKRKKYQRKVKREGDKANRAALPHRRRTRNLEFLTTLRGLSTTQWLIILGLAGCLASLLLSLL
ncbi:hypothetical protein RchiOBHm_Chr6g0247861 [Rosa chinensis]|uniref:Uncharacterized protein n=1 Tax=Rosa chinensis TaxID=74649 RepID=A0A2P6PJW2_ROSCH|nr:hypothetical protein RchiOBHm_Chr6g0247861 [Rosa chinensis]